MTKNNEKNVGIIVTPNFSDKHIFKNKSYFKDILEDHFNQPINVRIEIHQKLKEYKNIDDIFKELKDFKKDNNLDYTFFITDLLIKGEDIVAVEYNDEEKIVVLSLPIFIRPNFKEKIAEFIKQMILHFENGTDYPIEKIDGMSQFIKKDQQSRLVLKPKLFSYIKLVLGMALLNHPFAILSSLVGVIAIAFSTGAFGLVFSTMWILALNFSVIRLSITSVIAIIGMVIWVVTLHNLWTAQRKNQNDGLRKIYNSATVLTLLASVIMFYASLFSLFFISTMVLIPKDFLFNELNLSSDHSRFIYVKIAWFAASISTFAGAIGAGFESRKKLKDIIFQYPYKDEPKNSTEE